MFFLLLTLLIIAILLEGTVTTLPLVFVCLLCFLIVNKSRGVFYAAFLAGFIIDLFLVRTLGVSSLFFLVFFYLIILYQKKYEINSYPFVIVSSFLGTYLYLLILSKGSALQAASCSAIAIIIFTLGERVKRQGEKKKNYS